MKSEKIKRILLGLLALVAIYVWWGNLRLVTNSDESHYSYYTEPPTAVVSSVDAELSYEAPRINPFRRFESAPPPLAQKQPAQRPATPPLPPLSNQYTVTGIVLDADQPQAVLRDRTGGTIVVSVQDSIGAWIVQSIARSYVICKANDQVDTLRHETFELQH